MSLLGDAMSRFLARSMIVMMMASVLGPDSPAGPKPDLTTAASSASGGSTDHALWEQRAATRHAQRTAIKDDRGRLYYIVELDRSAPARFDQKGAPADGFASWHKPSTRHLVQDLKRKYGFRPDSITSLTGPSFQAFLDRRGHAQTGDMHTVEGG